MRASVLAWALAAVGFGLFVAFHVLDLINGHQIAPPIADTVVGLGFLAVGALVAWRRPGNPIGWIYLVASSLISIGGSRNLAYQYAYYALVTRPGALPAPEWAIWAGQQLLNIGFFGGVISILLLFPDGRLPSSRWRPLATAAVVSIVLLEVNTAFDPGALRSAWIGLANPARIPAAEALLDVARIPTVILLVGVLLGSAASVFVRFRLASGRERQQLKWFGYGAAGIPTVALLALALGVLVPEQSAGLLDNAWPLSVAGIPIATGLAILRLRLYDIDVLIRRTLVYGATTAAIGVAFFAGIVVLQAVLRPITGGSEAAVAASTLASFALFQPLRRRIQSTVDRRFYRSRYDAIRTLDEFSVRLRDQVALDAVRADLLDAVRETVQPAHASVWLRE